MRALMFAAALMAAPALAQPTLPTKDAPAKKEAAKKDSAKAKPAAGENIAVVNGVGVPKSRQDFFMQQQGQRGMPDNEQTRAMVREELINREVIVQEAQKSGVARTPEVQAQMELARQDILVGAYIRDYMRKHPVSDADVQKEYERAKSQAGDKEYKARHILVETEAQAKTLIEELKKGGKFEELASKNSIDPGSAQRGGELDWSRPDAYDKQFSDAMVKLEKGKRSETPVRTRFGFHIIQLDDVRAVKFPALAEVRQRIQQQLQQNRLEDLVKSLRAKAKIE